MCNSSVRVLWCQLNMSVYWAFYMYGSWKVCFFYGPMQNSIDFSRAHPPLVINKAFVRTFGGGMPPAIPSFCHPKQHIVKWASEMLVYEFCYLLAKHSYSLLFPISWLFNKTKWWIEGGAFGPPEGLRATSPLWLIGIQHQTMIGYDYLLS